MNREDFQQRCERLMDRSTCGQWDAEADLPWDIPVRLEQVTLRAPLISREQADGWSELPAMIRTDLVRTCLGTLLTNLAVGEAFVDSAAAELATRAPVAELGLVAYMQSVDEARHERVLTRYVREKLGYRAAPGRMVPASRLSEATRLARESWQTTALLMLILEVAALASIQGLREYCDEPLMQALLRRVVADESRHISGLTLTLRDPDIQLDEGARARLKRIAVLGWQQGLAVTEKPVLQVARLLGGAPEEEAGQEWLFFRRMIASTLIPKLRLMGLYDTDLETRLEAAGCPTQTGQAVLAEA